MFWDGSADLGMVKEFRRAGWAVVWPTAFQEPQAGANASKPVARAITMRRDPMESVGKVSMPQSKKGARELMQNRLAASRRI